LSNLKIVGRIFGEGPVVALCLRAGRIVAIQPHDFATGKESDWPAIAPGFCDLQVNGFNGVDFNQQTPLAATDFHTAAQALWAEGCTGLLPTLITNSAATLEKRFLELGKILDSDVQLAACTLGFHLEGPFISPKDGYRGAHDLQFVCAPDVDVYQTLQTAAGGRIAVLTLSPEWDGTIALIEAAVAAGSRVAIGHSCASDLQIKQAVNHGATLVTHFGNGVAQHLPRHPNIMWDQLANDGLACSLIADGFHLPDSVLKTAIGVKGDQAFLVSDSTSLAGLPPGDYETHVGGKVTLAENGKLHLQEQPSVLAGSAQSLRQCVEHLANTGLVSLADAWRRASTLPASLIGCERHASIEVGAYANVVQYEYQQSRLDIQRTWLRGIEVYSKQ